MTGDDARQAALDVIKFDFIDARETPEIGVILGAEIVARLGPRDERPLSILARDAAGAVVAGLNGVSHWRWLYVRHLYVAPGWRGQGLGRRLLARGGRGGPRARLRRRLSRHFRRKRRRVLRDVAALSAMGG